MDLEQMKQYFIKYGGSETILPEITEDNAESIVNLQKHVYELKQERDLDNYNNDFESSLQIIEDLNLVDLSEVPKDSDQYREIVNRRIAEENKVRLKLGLQPKEFEILDSSLLAVIALANDDSNVINEFLETILQNQRNDVKMHIEEMIQVLEKQAQEEVERLEFLSYASDKLEQLSKYKPEQYYVTQSGILQPNKIGYGGNLIYSS